ncbi:MAG: hypothetical protein M1820_000273 [Bogoriella megaspora]|nr:MAG: hypothetical protein M1820_000273 [Bogoriella megaspora]
MLTTAIALALLAGQIAQAAVLPARRALVTSFITTITTTVPPAPATSGFIGAPGAYNGSGTPAYSNSSSAAAPHGGLSIGLSMSNFASAAPQLSSILSELNTGSSKYAIGGMEFTFVPTTGVPSTAPQTSASLSTASSPGPSSGPEMPTSSVFSSFYPHYSSVGSSKPSSESSKSGTESSKPVHSSTSVPASFISSKVSASAPALKTSSSSSSAPASSKEQSSSGGIQITPLTASPVTSTIAAETFTMLSGSAVVTMSGGPTRLTSYVPAIPSGAPGTSHTTEARRSSSLAYTSDSPPAPSPSASSTTAAPVHSTSASSSDGPAPSSTTTPCVYPGLSC